jgi:hypothetical protein
MTDEIRNIVLGIGVMAVLLVASCELRATDSEYLKQILRLQHSEFCATVGKPPQVIADASEQGAGAGPEGVAPRRFVVEQAPREVREGKMRRGLKLRRYPCEDRGRTHGRGGLCAAAILYTLFALCLQPALAQQHPQGHDPYVDWKTRNGISCCHGRDCAPATAWQDGDGNWFARQNGQTYIIPPHAVLPIPSPDGRSHACVIGNAVICFVPGEVRG